MATGSESALKLFELGQEAHLILSTCHRQEVPRYIIEKDSNQLLVDRVQLAEILKSPNTQEVILC